MAKLYSVHPGMQMVINWVETLKEKSGRSLPEWLAHIEKNGPKTEVARREWLKRECKFGTNSASWLAERSVGKGGEDESPEAYLQAAEEWVEHMYAKKPAIRPVHDAIVAAALKLGKDVKVCPCQTIIPIFRNNVIAQIKPSTRTRLDFGLALGDLVKAGEKLPERLIDTGGFERKDRITHRIELHTVKDFDADARKWLQKAWVLNRK